VTERAVRREGAVLPQRQFLAVVEAAGRRRVPTSAATGAPQASTRPSLLGRLRGLFRR